MIRNTAFIIFTMILGLVTLSAAGVNIAPLLAGAGVVGVAIGFGSQTLVKDFMTGLFIVLENVIAVGDYVRIGEFRTVLSKPLAFAPFVCAMKTVRCMYCLSAK